MRQPVRDRVTCEVRRPFVPGASPPVMQASTGDPSLYFYQFVKQPLNKTWGELGQTHMMSYTADGSI